MIEALLDVITDDVRFVETIFITDMVCVDDHQTRCGGRSITSTVCKNELHQHGVQEWASQERCAGMGLTATVCKDEHHINDVRRGLSQARCAGMSQTWLWGWPSQIPCKGKTITSSECRDAHNKHGVQDWASQARCARIGITDTVCVDDHHTQCAGMSITSTVWRDEHHKNGLEGWASQKKKEEKKIRYDVQRWASASTVCKNEPNSVQGWVSQAQCGKISLMSTVCRNGHHKQGVQG